MTTTIQGLHIRAAETRSDPTPHTEYGIQVQAAVRAWEVWHRYSDFVDLHLDLGNPPFSLPPKHHLSFTFRRQVNDEKLVEERRHGLESYLRAILVAKDPQWRNHRAFLDFLEVPSPAQAPPRAQDSFSSASWLEEQNVLHALVRDIRADLYKRDSLASAGDTSASHLSNVEAKKKLATLISRVGGLAKGMEVLAKLGMSAGELARRGDMISRLQDDCSKLGEVVVAARSNNARQASLMAKTDPIPTADRVALLGAAEPPVTRVFGSRPRTPQETNQTRPLDDRGLLQYQQLQFDQQDTQLTQLSAILKRQMQLGMVIGEEIEDQNRILDGLATDVDRTGAKLGKARKQLGRIEGK
ncbi:syntaxin [Dacryopinax primogenitus]|uniref:Syntaxin n=1 Tax=Dacryopinax primogenitus (strain DJM 731) TaxID=1858805 RepID=M5GAN1_DACPD|nr:syntaxin [Dacryopinax primogenitus]EJU00978.1 syntaxin [Dacryopinax primogenitus]